MLESKLDCIVVVLTVMMMSSLTLSVHCDVAGIQKKIRLGNLSREEFNCQTIFDAPIVT